MSRIEDIEGALLTAIHWEGQWFPARVDLVSGNFEAFLFPFENEGDAAEFAGEYFTQS